MTIIKRNPDFKITKKQENALKTFALDISKAYGLSFPKTKMSILDSNFYYATDEVVYVSFGYDGGLYRASSDGVLVVDGVILPCIVSSEKLADPPAKFEIVQTSGQEQLSSSLTMLPGIKEHMQSDFSEEITDATNYILKELHNVVNTFCRIGYKLHQVKTNDWFKSLGYQDIYEYAKKTLGFKKSSTANYIAICERFCFRDEDGNPTESLLVDFVGFNYSQLCEMLTLSDDKLKKITPDMTVKQIRSSKKAENSGGGSKSDDSGDSESEAETDTDAYTSEVVYNEELNKDSINDILDCLKPYLNMGRSVKVVIY